MVNKPFLTTTAQIELLSKRRNLKILNEESAKKALERYGYYEIINGYKIYFLNDPQDDDCGYKTTANFEHIFALFTLDKRIRETVLEALEEFEQTFKQALAYVISESISDDQNKYVTRDLYNAGESHRTKNNSSYTDRDKLLKKMNVLLHSQFEPYNHYRTEHENIPPWILIKGLWFELSKRDIRIQVVARMIGLEAEIIRRTDEELTIMQAFSDLLFLYLDYRNICAHGGRTFSHRSKIHSIRHYSKFLYREKILDISRTQFLNGMLRSSVGAVILSLKVFSNPDPYQTIYGWIVTYISEHVNNYPEDLELLCAEMEIANTNIEAEIRRK